jgi:hypothetical protein
MSHDIGMKATAEHKLYCQIRRQYKLYPVFVDGSKEVEANINEQLHNVLTNSEFTYNLWYHNQTLH